MASTGKKEYTIKINGVVESVTEVTKLEDVVTSLDGAIVKVRETTVSAAKARKESKAALTDEEKATKKLEETQKKLSEINSEANRLLLEEKLRLQEAQREQTRKAKLNIYEADSIRGMEVRLNDMREAYKKMTDAQREEADAAGRGKEAIKELADAYAKAKAEVGQFQDNVGNYPKAMAGLEQLSIGINDVTKTTQGLAQGLLGATSLMSLFGNQTEEDAERAQKLQKVIALLTIAQQFNNNVLKQNIAQSKAASVLDAVRTAQIKAKTSAEAASTKGTVAATVAQKIFNVVASANPYVILALALVAVGAALFAFATKTDNAAKEQKKLNEQQSIYLGGLDREASKGKEVSNERVADLERQLRVLNAQGDKQAEIRKLEDKIASERKISNAQQRGFWAQEIKDLDANRGKLEELQQTLQRVRADQAAGKNKVRVDVNLDGKVEKVKVDEAIDAIQGQIDNYGRKVQVAVELTTEQKDLNAEEEATAARRKKEAGDRAKEVAKIELDAVRAAQDARLKLIQNTDAQARKTLAIGYDRQIEDLKKRLATEKNISVKARAALNDQIISLEKQKGLDLERLQKEQAARALALQQEVEDSRLALIVGEFDREYAETNIQYDRQIEAYKKRLAEDKTLTEEQQAQITELIVNAQMARGIALANLVADQTQQRADLELSAIEDALEAQQNKIDEMVVRNKSNKLELIDVEATRKNFAAANSALAEYILDLQKYLTTLREAHEATLSTLQEGTPEYIAEQQKYAKSVEDVTQRIKKAQKEQVDNTKASGRAQADALQDLLGKIAEIAQQAAGVIGQAMDTLNMALSAQIEDLNAQLDILNERYDEAQKQHEAAAARVEELEAQMQTATGGTAEALKAQLQDAMHARNDAARQEQQLAKQKERAEAEIAKKEKQMKRATLISNIAVGLANVAQAVTAALTAGPFVGQILAGITAALGAVQVGIMARQLAKLAKGGEIKGPSHAAGGVPIVINGQPSYEAQGGEFMVNDRSYGANKALVQYINATPRAITVADLAGVVPGDGAPGGISEVVRTNEDKILEAIDGINFSPVVAVTDIEDVAQNVSQVRDLAGV